MPRCPGGGVEAQFTVPGALTESQAAATPRLSRTSSTHVFLLAWGRSRENVAVTARCGARFQIPPRLPQPFSLSRSWTGHRRGHGTFWIALRARGPVALDVSRHSVPPRPRPGW